MTDEDHSKPYKPPTFPECHSWDRYGRRNAQWGLCEYETRRLSFGKSQWNSDRYLQQCKAVVNHIDYKGPLIFPDYSSEDL